MKRTISAFVAPVIAGAFLLSGCLMPSAAQAQTTSATVVATCGTPPTTYPAGANRALTQNTTGTLCTTGSGGGGGGGAVYGPTAAGSPAANPPVLMGGTQNGTATGTVQNWEIGSSGSGHVLEDNSASILSAVQGAIPAGTNAIGTLTGSTAYGLQSAASTNATSVKGSAGVVKAMTLINTTTTIYYLRMYNLASAPTCSSATGFVRSWPIPPAAAAGGAGGIAVNLGAGGTTFSTGIAFCVTGGPTSTDNTNASTGVFINMDYQ